MEKNIGKIIVIDVSSKSVKVGLVSEDLNLYNYDFGTHQVYNEDFDGFAKRFDMDYLWNTIKSGVHSVLKDNNSPIIGLTSCAQRMATVFVDSKGNTLYGGPNIDVRGIDSAYLIEDEFSEEELFKITGHSPSILFALSRLLWFKDEEEDTYRNIKKVLMLDDWIIFRLTGKYVSDPTSASDSQIFDVRKEKWSSEIIEAFDFDPDLFPEIIEPGKIVGELDKSLIVDLGINNGDIPVIKTGGDTQATLVGMGAINNGNIGISLGTTAPSHLIVDRPIFDPDSNHWLMRHSIKGKWLIEANAGNTGKVYDWFKECFFPNKKENIDDLIDKYVEDTVPGSDSTFAFLGPELMNIKDQTSIKKGVFVFQAPTIVSEDLPKVNNFAKAVMENICFGIKENYIKIKEFASEITKICLAGGTSKSTNFCQTLANCLGTKLYVPFYRDSAFIGAAINVLVGLKRQKDINSIISNNLKEDIFKPVDDIAKKYENIYAEWKGLKKKLVDL